MSVRKVTRMPEVVLLKLSEIVYKNIVVNHTVWGTHDLCVVT